MLTGGWFGYEIPGSGLPAYLRRVSYIAKFGIGGVQLSNYTNFIEDFPKRCCEIMEATDWAQRDREVTVALMAASAALLIPFERVQLVVGHHLPYPSNNKTSYPNALKELNTLLEKFFVGSRLWETDVRIWRFCSESLLRGDVDTWVKEAKKMSDQKQVRSVLTIIKSGLAHGNVYAKDGKQIDELVFACENRDEKGRVTGYRFLAVSPEDFRLFLKNWFQFTQEWNLPQKAVYDELHKAA